MLAEVVHVTVVLHNSILLLVQTRNYGEQGSSRVPVQRHPDGVMFTAFHNVNPDVNVRMSKLWCQNLPKHVCSVVSCRLMQLL